MFTKEILSCLYAKRDHNSLYLVCVCLSSMLVYVCGKSGTTMRRESKAMERRYKFQGGTSSRSSLGIGQFNQTNNRLFHIPLGPRL